MKEFCEMIRIIELLTLLVVAPFMIGVCLVILRDIRNQSEKEGF